MNRPTRSINPAGGRRTLLLLTVIACLPLTGSAKVFKRWSTRGRAREALEQLGGTHAYDADMQVNGQDARLLLYSLPKGIAQAMPELARACGADSVAYAGGSLGQCQIVSGAEALRLIVLDISSGEPRSLVIAISQSRKAFDATAAPPTEHPITELPGYPQATYLFHAHNQDTRTQVATMTTQDAPAYARTFYLQALEAAGWSAALPRTPDRPQPLLVYLKGNELCLVGTSSETATDRTTTITLLHKRLDPSKQGTS